MAALTRVAHPEDAAHRRHAIRDGEDVGALRRTVTSLATTCTGIRAGDAALIATELATNIVRHATGGGEVLLRRVTGGIELLAIDRGPGMDQVTRLGHPGSPRPARPVGPVRAGAGLSVGLASVARLATTFDLYSSPPEGTVVLARLLGYQPGHRWCRWGGVNVAVGEDEQSGDRWAVAANGTLAALVVDGLGHGALAAAASEAAVSVFGDEPLTDVAAYVATAHRAMLGTRGAVLGICAIDPARQLLRYAGVGNIAGRVLTNGAGQGLLSRDGTLGTQLPVPRTEVVQHQWSPGATLILASDGIRSTWNPLAYPGLLGHDPAVVAATLLRDHERGSDDATVLVVQDLRRDHREAK